VLAQGKRVYLEGRKVKEEGKLGKKSWIKRSQRRNNEQGIAPSKAGN